jgi:putative restriction endonuclease
MVSIAHTIEAMVVSILRAISPREGIDRIYACTTLFDRGYITVVPDYRVEVSRRIKEEFNNGVEYYAMHGKQIHLPQMEQLRPSKDSLVWHNENVFLP